MSVFAAFAVLRPSFDTSAPSDNTLTTMALQRLDVLALLVAHGQRL